MMCTDLRQNGQITYDLCLGLAKMSNVVRKDGIVVWYAMLLAELYDHRQADAGRWVTIATETTGHIQCRPAR